MSFHPSKLSGVERSSEEEHYALLGGCIWLLGKSTVTPNSRTYDDRWRIDGKVKDDSNAAAKQIATMSTFGITLRRPR